MLCCLCSIKNELIIKIVSKIRKPKNLHRAQDFAEVLAKKVDEDMRIFEKQLFQYLKINLQIKICYILNSKFIQISFIILQHENFNNRRRN